MATIQCRSIEKPNLEFTCLVDRKPSNMSYLGSDGKLKPIKKQRTEEWKVLAETKKGAFKIAKYHFYNSNRIEIL